MTGARHAAEDTPLGAAVALRLASGCAKTVVRPQTEATTTRLPRPEVVMVYDPAVSEAEVQENQGFFEQVWNSGSGDTQSEREREIGRQAAGAFAEWPRIFEKGDQRVVIHEPQLDSWRDFSHLAARALGDTSYKVHLDGYNLIPALKGEGE